MRFSTRAVLICFIPFALLLAASFGVIRSSVLHSVRDGTRTSMRDTHASIVRLNRTHQLQNDRILRVLGENATIKAGLRLVAAEPDSDTARLTLLDQLNELAEANHFDLLAISGPSGDVIGGVLRSGRNWKPFPSPSRSQPVQMANGLFSFNGRMFQLASVPINLGDEHVGGIIVGDVFDFSSFPTPTALTRNGSLVHSNIPNVSAAEVGDALASCAGREDCQVELGGRLFLSLRIQDLSLGDGYALHSLQNLEAAGAPIRDLITRVFLIAGVGALAAALLISFAASRSIVGPLTAVVRHLRQSEQTHTLPEFLSYATRIREIRELTTSFNRASNAIRQGQTNLRRAYSGFVSSMASALDARDPYTAGHSHRVSQMAVATAMQLQLSEELIETIRVGALLHDIGKIGVPDEILRKPGAFTKEEYELIKQHASIGRKILEPARGFQQYISIVELHHENWDGSGYPHGLKEELVPIGARIVHVVDAYDAITTNRPYRPGMTHLQAVEQLRSGSGTQFDPKIVEAFLATGAAKTDRSDQVILNLAAAVGASVSVTEYELSTKYQEAPR